MGNAQQNDPDTHCRQTTKHGKAVSWRQCSPLFEEEGRGENHSGSEHHVVYGFKHVGAETLQGFVDEEELDQDADSQRPQQAQEESQSSAASRAVTEDVLRHQAQSFAAGNGEASQKWAYGDVDHDVGFTMSWSDPHN